MIVIVKVQIIIYVLQSGGFMSYNFPGGSKFTRASEGPQNGGKMTGMTTEYLTYISGL